MEYLDKDGLQRVWDKVLQVAANSASQPQPAYTRIRIGMNLGAPGSITVSSPTANAHYFMLYGISFNFDPTIHTVPVNSTTTVVKPITWENNTVLVALSFSVSASRSSAFDAPTVVVVSFDNVSLISGSVSDESALYASIKLDKICGILTDDYSGYFSQYLQTWHLKKTVTITDGETPYTLNTSVNQSCAIYDRIHNFLNDEYTDVTLQLVPHAFAKLMFDSTEAPEVVGYRFTTTNESLGYHYLTLSSDITSTNAAEIRFRNNGSCLHIKWMSKSGSRLYPAGDLYFELA